MPDVDPLGRAPPGLNTQPDPRPPSGAARDGGHSHHRERIGNYVVGAEIGRGSFATVFKGHRSKSRQLVAIKAVSRQKLTNKLLDNLESEINILKAISHRNIVSLSDCFKNDTHIYLVMEYCSGADLSIYLRNRGRIDTLDFIPRFYESGMVASRTEGKVFWPHPPVGGLDERVTRCFLGQLALAVRFLRTQDLIHRDIKPQNLLLQPATPNEVADGHPLGIPILKVADFGFARILPAAAMAETLCGSPLYMAPEILRYEKYDAKADLWSVGAVLFEMAVGRSPFRAPNHVELLRRIEKGDDKIKFPDESSRAGPVPNPDGGEPVLPVPVSADIKQLIRGLLKRRPADRMSFEEFFASGVWDGYMTESTGDVSTSIDVSTDSSALGGFEPSESRVRELVQSIEASKERITPTHAPQPLATDPALNPQPAPLPAIATSRRPSTSADSSRPSTLAPTPVPQPPARRSEPKYYVGDEPVDPVPSSVGPSSAPTPVSRVTIRPPSTAPRRSSRGSPDDTPVVAPRPVIGSPLAATPPIVGVTGKKGSALDTADSVGQEYVVVEKRTVEINALADELEQAATVTRKPTIAHRNSIVSRPIAPFKPSASSPSSANLALVPASYSPPFAFGTTPPFAVPAVRQLSRPPSVAQALNAFPPQAAFSPGGGPSYAISPDRYSSSPSSLPSNANALARVLSTTAARLLHSSNTAATAIARATAKRWLPPPLVVRSAMIDPDEGDLLDFLEQTARKAFVLFEFADQRLQVWAAQTTRQTSTATPPVFTAPASISPTTPPLGAGAPPFSIPPVLSSNSAGINVAGGVRRKSSSSSMGSEIALLRQQEAAAGDACALYFKSLAFICIGHERFKRYWETRKERNVEYETSAELNETVQWFRARFNDVYEKAEWTKARCPEELPFVDRLVQDRARDVSRQSAQAELMNDLQAAEEGYDTALWLVSSLLDDVMYDGGRLRDEDRIMFEKLIGSIRDRLEGLRRKIDASRK